MIAVGLFLQAIYYSIIDTSYMEMGTNQWLGVFCGSYLSLRILLEIIKNIHEDYHYSYFVTEICVFSTAIFVTIIIGHYTTRIDFDKGYALIRLVLTAIIIKYPSLEREIKRSRKNEYK